jgi:hypothetical protein
LKGSLGIRKIFLFKILLQLTRPHLITVDRSLRGKSIPIREILQVLALLLLPRLKPKLFLRSVIGRLKTPCFKIGKALLAIFFFLSLNQTVAGSG